MSGVEDRSDFVKAAAVILIGMSRSLENDSICTQGLYWKEMKAY